MADKGRFFRQAVLTAFIAASFLEIPAQANITQIKQYKAAFPDEKPKCMACHISEKPKKEDGAHDLNEYGKKVVAINQTPDASTYKAAGKNEVK